MTSRRMRATVSILLLAAVAGLAAWWLLPEDPTATLRRRAETLARVERVAAPELGERVERWRMITTDGDTLSALWRAAAPGTERPWTAVLLGGLVSGERAALLLPERVAGHVLAVDWPWRESRHLRWWQIVPRLGSIRDAVLRSPAVLALGVEAAARQPEADPARVALVGVSLGVPPAAAALRITGRPAALALLHGAADLRAQFDAGLRREGVPAWLVPPLAALAARLVHPLEPSLHGDAVGARPVLLVNATGDPLLPPHAVERLHGTFARADVRWRAGLHRVPDRRRAIADTTREILKWLDQPSSSRL
jgi:hypothetical protein